MSINEFALKTVEMEDCLLSNNKRLIEENKKLKEQVNKSKVDWKLIAGIGYAVVISAIFINDLDN